MSASVCRAYHLKQKTHEIYYNFLTFSHSLFIRNGIRRIERGDYEEQNGQKVFVVRGFFEHITKDVRICVEFQLIFIENHLKIKISF